MAYLPLGGNASAVIFASATICADHFEYDAECHIIEAPSFFSAPYVPHVPGLVRGRASCSGTWNSGVALPKVGVSGILELDINGSIKSVSNAAIVESTPIRNDVDGRPYYTVNWVYDSTTANPTFTDFANTAASGL